MKPLAQSICMLKIIFMWPYASQRTCYDFSKDSNALPIHVVSFMLISKVISDLITDLISDFGIASMLNHTINLNLVTKFMVWFDMKAVRKFDIKSDIKFHNSIKL